MSSITHPLFVVIWYSKPIRFQRQSGWLREWLLRKMEFSSLPKPDQVLVASEERAVGISRDVSSDWDWHPFDFPLWMFFFSLPKESACMGPSQDYDAVETERFNQREWQYLGCSRAYLAVFSFVLMRLYFASFLGSLPLTLGFCQAVKSGCKNTHSPHMLIRLALNHDRDYTVRTVAHGAVKRFPSFYGGISSSKVHRPVSQAHFLQGREFLCN